MSNVRQTHIYDWSHKFITISITTHNIFSTNNIHYMDLKGKTLLYCSYFKYYLLVFFCVSLLGFKIRQLSEVAKYTGKAVMRYPVLPTPNQAPPFEPPMTTNGSIGNLSLSNIGSVKEADRPLVIELAVGAMSELIALAQMNEPLWKGGVHGTILDLNEYTRNLQNGLGPKQVGFRTEASRETAIVFMHHMDIVHRLMDVVS